MQHVRENGSEALRPLLQHVQTTREDKFGISASASTRSQRVPRPGKTI